MFKISYYVFGFENKYCCLFLINKGTLLYDQPSYKAKLLIILWIHDLLQRFPLSVSRSCLESVHKSVAAFIPTDNTWEKVVNAVVYIFFINITTSTTLFSVSDIMSFLKQCKQAFYALKPVLAILAATSVAFAWGDGSVNQDAVSYLVGTFKQCIFQNINPTPPMVSPPCSDGGACEVQEL